MNSYLPTRLSSGATVVDDKPPAPEPRNCAGLGMNIAQTGNRFLQRETVDADQSGGRPSTDGLVRLSGRVPAGELDYTWAVDQYYAGLYRFGFRLARSQSDAADLTQETYRILYTKGADIRDPNKIKSWLFMTLYRLFLRGRRRNIRFPQDSLEAAEWDLPASEAQNGDQLDSSLAVAALQKLDEVFRVPLTMFYLEDLSYREMAAVLGVPVGTIMSRLFRGKEILRRQLNASVVAA